MVSERMFQVLSAFPRSFQKGIRYEALLRDCRLSKEDIDECLNETQFPAWNYIRSTNGFREGSELFLTESGLAEMEEYERQVRMERWNQRALTIAKIAMWAAIASAVAAGISLGHLFRG